MSKYFVTVIVFVLFLTACGSSTTPTVSPTTEVVKAEVTPDSKDNELVVWRGEPLVKEQFEKKHPNVKITMMDKGWDQELYQNLINAIQLGTPPDVAAGESYFQTMAAAGQVMPIDDVRRD
jgi:ABC-type glycerol-3-phosphate transport system substrate-binding protein